ncbi:MAG TPA: transglutaminase family protein [Pseudorhodoplanes sp.]|jgi:transglutaminase-like putative cysteine protease|nr:transglutaminase family protein [Pseudorhodoplanes sp.]
MRMRVSHDTIYRYDNPPSSVIQTLRLTPRNHAGQYVVAWRVSLSVDCRLDPQEDAFGNLMHTFTAEGPLDELIIRVEGEVEIEDTAGVVAGAVERFPPALFLRETALTRKDAAIADFAERFRRPDRDTLTAMHDMLVDLNREMIFDPDPTHTSTTAAEAFALRRGVCQDLTHIFIAAARHLGVPARYVSGYFHRADGRNDQEAGHAWAEAFIPSLGWVGFDATNGICASDAHLRVAAGLDYLGAAPVRGARTGGTGEFLAVQIRVEQAMRQSQN